MITSGFGYFQSGPAGRPIQQVSQYLLYTDTNYVSGREKISSKITTEGLKIIILQSDSRLSFFKLNHARMPGDLQPQSTNLYFVLIKLAFLSALVTPAAHWVN